jgi:hypothetical protein
MLPHPRFLAAPFLSAALGLGLPAPAGATSLRFHGFGDDDVDRVKIPVDDPLDAGDEPGPPVDVGGTDFTIELFVKGALAENGAAGVPCGAGEGWIYGNILLDRDRWEPGGRDFGLSLDEGRLAFGVTNDALESWTLCGGASVLDGQWHHVAVQRRRSDGQVTLWVDGALDASGDGPDGDVSYPGDETPSGTNCDGGPCLGSDPFLVLGAEKHDAGPSFPSFAGFVDEVRVSRALRYEGPFAPPEAPFVPDAATAALYHLDEGSGDDVLDASGAAGGPSDGIRRFGGSPVPGPEWSPETPFGEPTGAGAAGASGAPLLEAHPNPALGQTLLWVSYPDGRAGPVAVDIHDVRGRRTASVAGTLGRGTALLVWNGEGEGGAPVSAGVYFARVRGDASTAAKIILR